MAISSDEEKRKNQLNNLKPYKPGESGNPSGKGRKSISIVTEIKRKLEEIPDLKDKSGKDYNPLKKKWLELFVDKMFHEAILKGDARVMKLVMNYIDGLPKGDMGGEHYHNNLFLVNNNIFNDGRSEKIARRIIEGRRNTISNSPSSE